MTDDLRQRIADAIERDAEKPAAEREGIIPAVLAIVQPELDRLRKDMQLWCDAVASAEKLRQYQAADADRYEEQLRAERDAVIAAAERVRSLHERREGDDGSTYCDVCSNHGDVTWPCATIKALGTPTETTQEAA